MPVDVGLWRIDNEMRRLTASGMPAEHQLEDLIEADLSVLGQPLLLIGRQVITAQGNKIDLLAMDPSAALHVIELKRDRTPRDVLAQALDYGSWVQGLTFDDIQDIYTTYCLARHIDKALEVAFDEAFGQVLPDELNTGHHLMIVATDLDPASERIVNYLATTYDVPINVVFFRYFLDEDREYVARTWLVDPAQDSGPSTATQKRRNEPWNGLDWYVCFGESPDGRRWEDAVRHGFVSAGGGEWYSQTLRNVPDGARVWAYIPKVGYVGVGASTGPAAPFEDSKVYGAQGLAGSYVHDNGEAEWILPVEWLKTVPQESAFREKGLFANQNSAVRLRSSFTLQRLEEHFQVND